MLVGGAVGFRGVLCLVRMAVASLLADLEPEFKRRKGTSCSGSACKELGSCHSVTTSRNQQTGVPIAPQW